MIIEAGNKDILALLLAEGKDFERMDPVLAQRLIMAINLLLASETVEDLRAFGRYNLKEFNGIWQINIGPEKRLRFVVQDDTVRIDFFGSTTHKGEGKG